MKLSPTPVNKPSLPAGRMPPFSLEAEQAVLGGILLQSSALDKVADILGPEDFYRDNHGKIYRAMLDLYQRREPIDLVTVTSLLHNRQQLEDAGGPGLLAALSEQVGSAVNIEYHAHLVHDKAILRRLIGRANDISTSCYSPVESVEELLDWAEAQVFEIAEAKMRSGFYPVGRVVESEIAVLEGIWGRKEMITGVPSHFRDLDKLTAGFQPSDLIILAARPSMGKTALALNIAYNAAQKSKTAVAVFSLEMSKEQLSRRLLSSIGEIDASNLRRAFLSNEEWAKLQEAAGELMDCPLVIDDTPAVSALEVRAKCRRLKSENRLGLIIIDYLQLMRGRKDVTSREQEISEISRSLKALAKELHVPIIALSQLNRRVEERPNKRPQLADLRESGAIEQDADVIVFIYRDEVYNKESPHKGAAEIIIGKQRNGPTGSFNLSFRSHFTRFDDFSEEAPPLY